MGIKREGNRPVNHDLFAETCWDNIVAALEGSEDPPVYFESDWLEPVFFANPSHSPTEDDSPRGKKCNRMGESLSQSGSSVPQYPVRSRVSLDAGLGHHLAGYLGNSTIAQSNQWGGRSR